MGGQGRTNSSKIPCPPPLPKTLASPFQFFREYNGRGREGEGNNLMNQNMKVGEAGRGRAVTAVNRGIEREGGKGGR